jgi:predicted GIY-YIG superfamily endonuclease
MLDRRGMGPRRFVYLIQSVTRPDRHYIGRTHDMPSRLASHNAGESPRTCNHRPWRLVVSVAFASEAKAMEFERYLKSASGGELVGRYFL